MQQDKEKFATQADPQILAALRTIAKDEGRQFQAVMDEAMRDYIEKKRSAKPRAHVMAAVLASMEEFDLLYKKLAE